MSSTITISNDKIATLPLVFDNYAGTVVAPIAGDTFAVSSSSASLDAAIGGTAAAPTVVLTPMVQAGTGYTVTVSSAKGLAPIVLVVNITPDPTLATSMSVNTGAGFITTVVQAVPTAPGP